MRRLRGTLGAVVAAAALCPEALGTCRDGDPLPGGRICQPDYIHMKSDLTAHQTGGLDLRSPAERWDEPGPAAAGDRGRFGLEPRGAHAAAPSALGAGSGDDEAARYGARPAEALRKARGLAERLKAAPEASDGALGALEGPGRGGGARHGDRAREERPKPADLDEELGLFAAARSGHSAAFEASGLRFGRGPDGRKGIMDENGQPASAARLAALRQELQRQPKALLRRPDFFSVVARSDYEQVKALQAASADRRELKDIGVSPGGRDLVWTRSCDGVSGSCNPLAAEGSYAKGREIAPETLARVAGSLRAGPEVPQTVEASMVSLPAKAPSGLAAAVKSWLKARRLAAAVSRRTVTPAKGGRATAGLRIAEPPEPRTERRLPLPGAAAAAAAGVGVLAGLWVLLRRRLARGRPATGP